MKKTLIAKFCTTRKKIDELAKNLDLSAVGAREKILESIGQQSYSKIKKAIDVINKK